MHPLLSRSGRNVAMLDLGSNSLRMMIARVNPDHSATVVTHIKKMVRLGEGAFETGRLQKEPMRRTLAALREFAVACEGRGVSDHAACGTAAMRDAANGLEFAEAIRRDTGFEFRVISGREEARLISLGVTGALPPLGGSRMLIDIGGGSTELSIARDREMLDAESLSSGAVRMTAMFINGDGPVQARTYERIKAHVRSQLEGVLPRFRALAPVELIGSSGTIKCLARMGADMNAEAGREGLESRVLLTYAGLRRAVLELCLRREGERAFLPGMNPRRTGILIPGAAILETVMEEAGFETLRYSDRGLREGMLADYLRTRAAM